MQRDRAAVEPTKDQSQAKTETFEHRDEGRAGTESNASKASAAGGGLDAALGVANNITGGVEKLADFVADFLSGSVPPPKRDPHTERVENIIAQRRALDALERIRDNIKSGKTLKPEDLQNLTPEHLNNIRSKGDDYLRDLIRRMEEERERDRGRERER